MRKRSLKVTNPLRLTPRPLRISPIYPLLIPKLIPLIIAPIHTFPLLLSLLPLFLMLMLLITFLLVLNLSPTSLSNLTHNSKLKSVSLPQLEQLKRLSNSGSQKPLRSNVFFSTPPSLTSVPSLNFAANFKSSSNSTTLHEACFLITPLLTQLFPLLSIIN